MEIKRINSSGTCDINNIYFGEKICKYITFNALDKTEVVNHMFSTRLGGVSKGFLSEMNLSFTRGDDYSNVIENYSRVAQIMNCTLNDFVCSDQTHTTNVRLVTATDKGKGVKKLRDYSDVDALITNERGIVLSCFFADCVPLFIVDPIKKAIGLAHSGWRGTANRIGKVTLEAMKRSFDTNPGDVNVVIGPSICQNCYEVSEDVASVFLNEFGNRGSELIYKKDDGKYMLNLHYANKIVFQEAGVKEANIAVTDICTCCNSDLLFSHRKTNGERGNLAAFLSLK